MKRKFFLLIICLFVFVPCVNASTNTNQRSEDNLLVEDYIEVTDSNKGIILNTPSVNADEKIYDFADLFTSDEEELLYEKILTYINNYNIDFALVTIDDNSKTSSQNYADDFYDYNSFSQEAGVLFLIDMDNREIYMSTTGDAISMYNDYRIDTALDAVYSYMSNQNYYSGVVNYLRIISDFANQGYPTTSNNQKSFINTLLISIILALIITVIVMIILINRNKMVKKAQTAEKNINKEQAEIKNLGEMLISTHTSRHHISHDNSSGNGHSGSSTHTSSSGHSHGGGGHKF